MEAEPRGLEVSIVVYHTALSELRQALDSLHAALVHSRDSGLLEEARVWLVDNGSETGQVESALADSLRGSEAWLRYQLLRGHGNVGYGSGHDLAIQRATGRYHLVLNPDVVLDPDAVTEALAYLDAHPEVGLVTPHATDAAGQRQFLCKRYPSVLVLALRGFGPQWLQRPFRHLLDRYEMRDLPEQEPTAGIPIASGCFMLARGEALRAIGGFSPRYFLYFEDFDLSLRFRRLAEIAYVPAVRIIHGGGNAARKGLLHQRFFIRSAFTFFRTHGWRLW
jgi:GT2 family glycosyltransferase